MPATNESEKTEKTEAKTLEVIQGTGEIKESTLEVSQKNEGEGNEDEFDFEPISRHPPFKLSGLDGGEISTFGFAGAFMLAVTRDTEEWVGENIKWLGGREKEREAARKTLEDRAAEKRKTSEMDALKAENASMKNAITEMRQQISQALPTKESEEAKLGQHQPAQETEKPSSKKARKAKSAKEGAEAGKATQDQAAKLAQQVKKMQTQITSLNKKVKTLTATKTPQRTAHRTKAPSTRSQRPVGKEMA